jgi:hypothetical protein
VEQYNYFPSVPALACNGAICTLNIKVYLHNRVALLPSLQNYMPFDCLLFLSIAQQPLVGQSLFNIEASLSHSHTPHAVGLLWASDELVEETSTYTPYNTHKTHPCPGEIRTRYPSKRAAADPRLRRRGHRDWLRLCIGHINPVILLYQHNAPCSSSSSPYSVLSSTNILASLRDSNKYFLELFFHSIRRPCDARSSRCSACKVSLRNLYFYIF